MRLFRIPSSSELLSSPTKPTRNGPPADPATLPLPVSPEKSRTIRRQQSHQQLSSTTPSSIAQHRSQQQKGGLARKESKDQIHQNAQAVAPTQPTRTRANSDVAMPMKRPAFGRKLPSIAGHARKSSLEAYMRDGPQSNDIQQHLAELREMVLTRRVEAGKDGMSEYRIYLWLVFLNIPALPTDDYLALVHRGRSPAYEKISNDTFRTLATDTLFKRRVTDASITRLLNATAWKLQDAKKASRLSTPGPSPTESETALYVQGMNVLAAPFLYASRSETEAFALFHTFLTGECPGYVRGAMEGVHKGLALVDKCLSIVNPTLANFLLSKQMPAKIYAFPSVLTFCACTPPLPEVLHLWDFLFAYGPHLNILCIVAQLLMLKDTLLASPR